MQMLMKAVKIKNFRGYGESPQREDGFYCFDQLDKDFVLISGFNGFGKTSFYEAIEWCLSDSVNRLEKLKNVYNIPDLRKGKYLKFQKANGQSTDDREIIVEIQFIEKASQQLTTFTRRTHSNMLGVGDYTSTLYMQQNEDPVYEASSREIKSVLFGKNNLVLETEILETNKFLFSNIMTQDNLHDFLNANDLKERQQLFLRLMSSGEEQKISESMKGLSKRNFTSKLNSVNKEIEIKEAKINRVSEKVQVANTKVYFDNLNTEVRDIHTSLLGFLGTGIPIPITMENYKDFLKKLNGARDSSLVRNIQIDIEIRDLLLHRTKMAELSQIKQVVDILQKEKAVNRLISKNLASLNSFIEINSKKLQEAQLKLQEAGMKEEQYQRVLSTGHLVQQRMENKRESFKSQLEQFIQNVQIHEQSGISMSSIQQLDAQDEGLRQNANYITQKIHNIEQQLQQQQTVNKNYSDLLQTVSTYIMNQKEIDQCPVCHNTKVQDENITKTGLLRLIDATIAQGSTVSATIIQEQRVLQESLKITQLKIDDYVRKPILDYVYTTIEKVNNLLNTVNNEISQLSEHIQELSRKLQDQQLERQQFEMDISILGIDSNFTEATIIEMQRTIEVSVKAVRDRLPESLRYAQFTDLNQQQQSIEQSFKDPISEHNADELIKQKQHQYQFGNEIITKIQFLEGWVLQGEDLQVLQQQHQYEQELLQLKMDVKQIERLNKDFIQLHTNLVNQEEIFIKSQLEKHPIITWIYEMINPHPFYKKLEIINEKGGLHFKNEGKEIHLDQIFSASQSNILVLSIFLGLGMSHRYSALGQLFLDDPIQSMDDVNILGFIDLLRAILDSQSEQNNLVISTHDSNFAKLLGIKMRNRPFIEYQIVAYGEEGPLIEVNVH